MAAAGEPGGLGFFTENLAQLLLINDHDVHGTTTDPVETRARRRPGHARQLLLDGLDDVVTFDLLIGADGVGSQVRDQFLPQSRPVDTEALSVASKLALTPASRAWVSPRLAASMNMIIAPAPYFLFTSPFQRRDQPAGHHTGHDDDLSYILCTFVAHRAAYPRDVRELDTSALHQVVTDLTACWHPDLRRLIADAEPGSVSLQPHRASVPVTAWKTTTVTLIGDALHAMPPVGGLGGNAALRDAHLLCRTLTRVERGTIPLSRTCDEAKPRREPRATPRCAEPAQPNAKACTATRSSSPAPAPGFAALTPFRHFGGSPSPTASRHVNDRGNKTAGPRNPARRARCSDGAV